MTKELDKKQRWARLKARCVSVIWAVLAFFLFFVLGVVAVTQLITNQDLWIPLATGIAVLSAVLVYLMSMTRKSRYAKCPSCSAPFSLVLIDRDEKLISAVPRQATTLVSRSANDGTPHYRHDSWVDEFYRVVDTVECDKCGEQFERKYNRKSGSGRNSSTDWGNRTTVGN